MYHYYYYYCCCRCCKHMYFVVNSLMREIEIYGHQVSVGAKRVSETHVEDLERFRSRCTYWNAVKYWWWIMGSCILCAIDSSSLQQNMLVETLVFASKDILRCLYITVELFFTMSQRWHYNQFLFHRRHSLLIFSTLFYKTTCNDTLLYVSTLQVHYEKHDNSLVMQH